MSSGGHATPEGADIRDEGAGGQTVNGGRGQSYYRIIDQREGGGACVTTVVKTMLLSTC